MIWIFAGTMFLIMALGMKSIPSGERGIIIRLGRTLNKVVGPGFVFVVPFCDRLQTVSIEPFSVSLPPQSAITKDEIPIQLQASLDATVRDPLLALSGAKDWRIYVMSLLQTLMKDGLEELDFDNLDQVFPGWVKSIERRLSEGSNAIGVEIKSLQVSNLSPRTKPG